ncbi:MAG: class I SAM-dependent methyltransferase [Acidimicrobiales bacterium]|nr:class I SAM-dependent methyltransferase [Acidimicrobiales bacterium]
MTTISSDSTVQPDALFRKARLIADAASTPAADRQAHNRRYRMARAAVTKLLGRITSDSIVISEDGNVSLFGPGNGLEARLTVHDPRAWWHLATEGSIGLGRGFIEGWWHSEEPEVVVRIAARNMTALDEFRNRMATMTNPVMDRLRHIAPKPDRSRNREDIGAHYDLGNAFFRTFLDESMTYSSAVFETPDASLFDASMAKYDRLLSKLRINSGMTMTEIGTGWGGMALRAAGTFGATVTSTTISREQYAEANRRMKSAEAHQLIAPNQVRLLEEDWRDLASVVAEPADRLVSVEMIEAVDWRDYPDFFRAIEANTAEDGMIGLQAICVPDRRYERTKNTDDFIARFVFPGGFLPSIGKINQVISRHTKLQLIDVEDFGAHYAETLRQWRDRFDSRIDEIHAMGLDSRFVRLWRFYLAYCEAAFAERHCTVNQLILVGPAWRPDGLTLRPA